MSNGIEWDLSSLCEVHSNSSWNEGMEQQCIGHIRCYVNDLPTRMLAVQAVLFQVDWMFHIVL
jgi:hypothetical protein